MTCLWKRGALLRGKIIWCTLKTAPLFESKDMSNFTALLKLPSYLKSSSCQPINLLGRQVLLYADKKARKKCLYIFFLEISTCELFTRNRPLSMEQRTLLK